MIAVDTNIIIRLLTQDDEIQYKQSLGIFTKNEIIVLDTVILKTNGYYALLITLIQRLYL